MLKCKDIAHRASHYLDANLPWHKKVGWYLHLALCHRCRRFVRQFRTTLAVAKRLRRQQCSTEELQKTLKSLEQTQPVKRD